MTRPVDARATVDGVVARASGKTLIGAGAREAHVGVCCRLGGEAVTGGARIAVARQVLEGPGSNLHLVAGAVIEACWQVNGHTATRDRKTIALERIGRADGVARNTPDRHSARSKRDRFIEV